MGASGNNKGLAVEGHLKFRKKTKKTSQSAAISSHPAGVDPWEERMEGGSERKSANMRGWLVSAEAGGGRPGRTPSRSAVGDLQASGLSEQ